MSIWICSLGKSLIRKNNQKTDPETYFVSLVLANTCFFPDLCQPFSRFLYLLTKQGLWSNLSVLKLALNDNFLKQSIKTINLLIYFPWQCSWFIIALHNKQRDVYHFLFTIEMTVWTIIFFFFFFFWKTCLWVWS